MLLIISMITYNLKLHLFKSHVLKYLKYRFLNLKIFALSVISNDKKYTVITQVDKSTVM